MKKALPQFKATFSIQKAANDEAGEFFVEGYASHGDVDSEADKISAAALQQLSEMIKGVVVLHNHNPELEVGKVVDAKFEEDTNAVWVRCQVMDAEVIEKITDERLNGFSIHAMPRRYEVVNTSSEFSVTITEWERVVELSVTSVPVQEKARILNWFVKAFATEVRQMEHEELKAMIKSMLEEQATDAESKLAEAIKAAVGEGMTGLVEQIVTAVGEKVKAEGDPVDETVQFSGGEEADFLMGQAEALEAIELEDDAATAMSAVANALRARADVLREATESSLKALVLEAVNSLKEEVKSLGEKMTGNSESIEAVKSLIDVSRQEPEPNVPEAKKSAFAGAIFGKGEEDPEA
jgi:HK97 family phage prohead protease